MAVLAEISVKRANGTYDYFTIGISDETNKYAQNVTMWRKQSKEDQDAKAPKDYVGNGRVFWTDGKCVKGKTKEELKLEEEVNKRQAAKGVQQTPTVAPDAPWTSKEEDDLPF